MYVCKVSFIPISFDFYMRSGVRVETHRARSTDWISGRVSLFLYLTPSSICRCFASGRDTVGDVNVRVSRNDFFLLCNKRCLLILDPGARRTRALTRQVITSPTDQPGGHLTRRDRPWSDGHVSPVGNSCGGMPQARHTRCGIAYCNFM